VTGDVRVLDAGGQVRPIVADTAQIRSGDTVRISGNRSATVVACADGTRLTLVGNTSVTCGQSVGMSFVIHHGTLAAAVQPQRGMLPLVLATPTAQVEVLGTRLLIEAGQRRTDLNVTEGRVRLVRVKDGETIEVGGGKRAVVTDQKQLLVEDIPRLSDAWEVDFEEGLPAAGRLASTQRRIFRRTAAVPCGPPATRETMARRTIPSFRARPGPRACLPWERTRICT
jgi:hypothetical protein